jgi:hypothetical protein
MSDGNIIEHKMPVVNTFMSKNASFIRSSLCRLAGLLKRILVWERNGSRHNGQWQYPVVPRYYYITMLEVIVPVG